MEPVEKEVKKPDKIQALLIITVALAFLLRFINANTRILYGDPPHFLLHAINFLKSGLLVTYDQSTFLWYAFTDIVFKLFGISQVTSRLTAVILGTLTVIAIYLFTREFFGSRRAGLISAMIYAFVPVFIFNADDEHDIALLFFIIAIFYALIKGLKNNSRNYLLISGVLFGIACMWKAYIPILIIPYLGFIGYYHYTKRFDLKKNYKIILYVLGIILLLVSPTLVYNSLNYSHNEVTDLLFAKFFKVFNNKTEALYSWSGGGELYRTFEFKSPSGYAGWFKDLIYEQAPLLTLFGFLSLVFLFFKRKDEKSKDYLVFYALYFVLPFIFLVGSIVMAKHYMHFLAFLIPPLAYSINVLIDYLSPRFSKAFKFVEDHIYISYFVLILILFFTAFSFSHGLGKELLFSANPESGLIKYKISDIPEKSLVIYDDRIYNAFAGWLFNDRYYLPVSAVNDFLAYNAQSSTKETIPVFIVECAVEDCGWGSVSKNPALNQSMEGFFASLANQSIKPVFSSKEKIFGSYYNPILSTKPELNNYYTIYKTNLPIDLNLAKQFKLQYSYFLYPLRYENPQQETFQNFIYKPSGALEGLFNSLAWLIFYADILLSLGAILFVLYELWISPKSDI